mmetsp:Transcript_25455/g.83771  ORF Transcript_25455/g.83771 Transcript_25455/m.83771 type:complete len:253 (-) Transcript_25455:337-1095(-)
MRMYVSCPKRPSSSLKASATSGSSGLPLRTTGASSFERSSAVFSTSSGLGRYLTTPSRRCCTPLFLNAEPTKTGAKASEIVARRIAASSCSPVGSSPSRKSSASSSSQSATASMSSLRWLSLCSFKPSGISSYTIFSPRSPWKNTARMWTRSTQPSCLSSSPIGSVTKAECCRSLSRSCPSTRCGSAPERSALLIKTTRGTLYRRICRSTVTLWLCTPPTLHSTSTAPSNTRSARSTSIVKSTWPGVSMMLT